MVVGHRFSKGEPYCIVYFPHSIDACGSEFRFSRRMTIFAFALGSESSASDYGISNYGRLACRGVYKYLFIIDGGRKHEA